MKSKWAWAPLVGLLATIVFASAGPAPGGPGADPVRTAAGFPAATTPVAYWSTEARCAIVPPTAGPENFGNKFPGEAAVYMGIVHVAIYDAAVAIEGGYRPFLPTPRAPAHTSPAAAIAAAAHDTLVGLQPALGLNAGQQAILDSDYAAYLAAIPDGTAKTNGLAVGQQIAAAAIAWRQRRPGPQPHRCRPRPTRTRSRGLAARPNPAGAWPAPARHHAAGPHERLAVPARRPARADQSSLRPRPQPGRAARAPSTAPPGRPSKPNRRSSGPTTTSGYGTTACSASPPSIISTSSRPRGCWPWRTSPAATP